MKIGVSLHETLIRPAIAQHFDVRQREIHLCMYVFPRWREHGVHAKKASEGDVAPSEQILHP